MRGILLAGAIALGVPHLAASELVTVEEAGIRALLPGKTASITIQLENSLDRAVQGTLAVSWAGPDNKWSSPALLDVEIPRGKSGHTLPLELEADAWTRLRYTLTPRGESVISFSQRSGIVALAQVSPDVFEVKLSLLGSQHLSGPVRAHAVAQHPATLLPVDGIEWSAEIVIGEKRLAEAAIRPIGNGFVELSFEVPPHAGGENLDAQLTVHARRGGFAAYAEAPVTFLNRAQGQIQTDKPLYRPGQTIRWRAVLTTAGGKAAAGMKAVVRISSAQGDLSHSVETTASRHGIVHGEWKVPDTAEADEFTIGVRHSEDGDSLLAFHRVKVSRYELPAFTVSVTPGQTFYLPGHSARVTVSAAYLFGKPVTGGRVRIQNDDQLLAEGTTAAAGTFTAVLSLADAAPLGHQDFRDTTLAAFVTDPASGRTEQRKATVRVSRKPIHLYVAASRGPAIYVSASHADGRPAALPVEVQAGQHLVRVQTNRYGVAKAVFPGLAASRTPVELRARYRAGGTISVQSVIRIEKAGLTLEADRSLHRSGEAVRLALHTVGGAPTAVLVRAITAKGVVASRAVMMDRGSGEVTFPYQPEFAGRVVFVAWAGESLGGQATAGTIYPDGSGGLQLTAAADRPEYAPGSEGTISLSARTVDGRAADAAFGIAIVDQAVHERSRTDQEFGRRPVFSCAWCGHEGEGEIGGVRINDLIFRGDGPVTPELDLVAEALLARRGFSSWEFSNSKPGEPPEFTSVKETMEEWNRRLEAHYRATLEFPRDLGSFVSILRDSWLRAEDPWQQPYMAEFGFSGPRVQARVISASRDKKPGTRDDLAVRTFEWRYFLPYERIIGDILRQQVDYPATPAGLLAVLRRGGLDLAALRDPWGNAYEAQVLTQGSHRLIGIRSPGDGGPESDPVHLAFFQGTYFNRERNAIEQALRKAPAPPRSQAEFLALAKAAGVDIAALRDAWGNPYEFESETKAAYEDRITLRRVRQFGGAEETSRESVPVTRHYSSFNLWSRGGNLRTKANRFAILSVRMLVREEARADSKPRQKPLPIAGAGAIAGTITDASGAVIAGTAVMLTGNGGTRQAVSDQHGRYRFEALAAGRYSVSAHFPGFLGHETVMIPVRDELVRLDVVLQAGGAVETVEVQVEAPVLQTETAMLSFSAASTPRVREYFPETLLWLPEAVADPQGQLKVPVRFADSITTWKLAVFASTPDGQTAQIEKDLRVFQPFFLDFDPPEVLTQGDEVDLPVTVRNYTGKDLSVRTELRAGSGVAPAGLAAATLTITARQARNTAFAVRAEAAHPNVPLRITSAAGELRDAIEKPVRVRTAGQEFTAASTELVGSRTTLRVTIPPEAIPGSGRTELRIYPNPAALLFEGASTLLTVPHGCAEQTISAGYANLIAWRLSRSSGGLPERLEARALDHVQKAVDALERFPGSEGGLSYWGGSPDTAVTAYGLAFLLEASEVKNIRVPEIARLVEYLENSQNRDGLWPPDGAGQAGGGSFGLAAAAARSLAKAAHAGLKTNPRVLAAAYHQLSKAARERQDPYLLAQLLSAALDSGDSGLAADAAARLKALARHEAGTLHWDTLTNTPFHGWGSAGREETTGAAISALAAWRRAHPEDREVEPLLTKGAAFLLQRRRAEGHWSSAQSTVRAMLAISEVSPQATAGRSGGSVIVRAAGKPPRTLEISAGAASTDPLVIDTGLGEGPGVHEVTVEPSGVIAAFTAKWAVRWDGTATGQSPGLRYSVAFNALNPRPGDLVRCTVKAERVGHRGYGMILAEVGLPPGADVDRSSLEKAREETDGLDHYEILPGRAVFYLWPRAGGVTFPFELRLRMGLKALSQDSVLYDYNNPEERVVIAPSRWVTRPR